jgi:uncharacterized membrane protein
LHIVASLGAVVAGLCVVVLDKGTARHRLVGKVYAALTYTLCGASFFIFETSGTFSVFHMVAIQNAALVTAGLAAARLRNRLTGWVTWHLRFMMYSYLALVATGALQFLEYLPFRNPRLDVPIFVFAPMLAGWFAVEWRLPHWRAATAPSGRSG